MTMPHSWADLPVPDVEYNEDTDTIIRQSTLGQLFLCGKRVEYENHPDTLAMVSEPLAFGQCVHHMVEQTLLGGNETELLSTMKDWVEEILNIHYEWSLDQVPDVHEFFSELAVAYRTYMRQIYPKIKNIISLEEEIFLPLGEGASGTIFLKGTPDIITKTRLRDTKTAGKGWAKTKAELSIQATLYLALAKQSHELDVKDFTFDVYNKRKSTWESIPVTRRVKDINSALRTAYDAGRQLEAGIYVATPVPEASFNKKRGWYCSDRFCEAWNACDYKYLSDDVDESEVAVRSW